MDEELRRLLEAGDGPACARWLLARTPKERRALAPVVRASPTRSGPYGEASAAHAVAQIACLDGEELARRGWPFAWYAEGLEDLLAELRPPWLEAWAAAVLEKSIHAFRVVLPLAAVGALPWPTTPGWVQGLVNHGVRGRHRGGPRELLAQHPALLAQVPLLFQVEGEGEGCLAAADKFTPEANSWGTALRELSDEGSLDRAELLAWTVAALGRGFSTFRAGWFSRFHDALEPSVAELAGHQAAYRELLGCPTGPTQALALRALDQLARAGTLEGPATVAALEAAVTARAKGTARRALRLAARVAGPAERGALARVAAVALAHKAREVQEDALGILEEHAEPGDAALAELAAAAAAGVVPTLRARLEPWVGTSLPAPVLALQSEDVEPDADVDAVRPVQDRAELEGLLLEWLGTPADPLLLERVLDGAARLAGEPAGAEAPRLAKLASKVRESEVNPTYDEHPDQPRAAMACLAHRLATGEALPLPPEQARVRVRGGNLHANLPEYGDLLARRIAAVLRQIEDGAALPLLAMPTHRPCWVAAGVLVDRLRHWEDAGREPPALEVAQALLRLAPAGRVGAAREARGLRSEAGRALRYALGENLDVGGDPVIWVAAGQARSPGRPPPEVAARHPGLGPGVDAPAEYTVEPRVDEGGPYVHRRMTIGLAPAPPERLDPEILPALVHTGGTRMSRWSNRRVAGFEVESVRRAALATPADQEWYFAEGARALDPEWYSAQWEIVDYLGPLRWPDLRPGPMGHLLLALALGAKEKGQRGAGAEILVQTHAEGRLDLDRLTSWVRPLLASRYLAASRFTKAMEAASRGGGAVPVRALLDAVAPPVAAPGVRGIGGLLELWLELQVAAEARWSGEAPGLEALAERSGKAARAAKALLGRRAS